MHVQRYHTQLLNWPLETTVPSESDSKHSPLFLYVSFSVLGVNSLYGNNQGLRVSVY